MLPKSSWFKCRTYNNWRVALTTWQGWTYIAVILLSIAVLWVVTSRLSLAIQLGLFIGWLILWVIDSLSPAFRHKMDEHASTAERNAVCTMVVVIVLGILYQGISSAIQGNVVIDEFLPTALFLGMAARSMTNSFFCNKQ